MATKYWVGGASGATGDWSNAANWSPSGVPQTGDNVFIGAFGATLYDIDAGLDQSAVTLASLTILQSYTEQIGTAASYLQIGATICTIGQPGGNTSETGSTRIAIDFGAVQTEVNVLNSASASADTALEPIRLKGTNAHNALNISGGRVGIGTLNPAEVATFSRISTSQVSGTVAPALNLGPGCTLTTIDMAAGTVINRGSNVAGTLTVSGGTYTADQAATHATVNVRGGTVVLNSDGTVSGTITVQNSGALDLSQDARSQTISKIILHGPASLNLNNGRPGAFTITNGIDVYGAPTIVLPADGINVALSTV